MTAKELAEALIRCVRCAENWSGTPWPSMGECFMIEDISGGDRDTKIRILLSMEVEEREGEFYPLKGERFTVTVRREKA